GGEGGGRGSYERQRVEGVRRPLAGARSYGSRRPDGTFFVTAPLPDSQPSELLRICGCAVPDAAAEPHQPRVVGRATCGLGAGRVGPTRENPPRFRVKRNTRKQTP